MLFQMEAILTKDNGQLAIMKMSGDFIVRLTCKFGELRSQNKSLTDGITAVLRSYKVLSENEVTLKEVPF